MAEHIALTLARKVPDAIDHHIHEHGVLALVVPFLAVLNMIGAVLIPSALTGALGVLAGIVFGAWVTAISMAYTLKHDPLAAF